MGGLVDNDSYAGGVRFARVYMIAGLALLSGCSQWQIGEKDYGCPGMPEGARCMSSRDVYLATDSGPLNEQPQHPGDDGEVLTKTENRNGSGSLDPVVQRYVAPAVPDRPVPIRTPAEVMRIWIAPWEDDNGDLNVTGYLYTEIEPRRWVIAEKAAKSAPSLTPLEVAPQKKATTKPNTNEQEGK